MSSQPESTVRRYLDRLVSHDWAGVTECLHPDVVRVGPFADTYSPRDHYVQFLASVMPSLVDYRLTVERLVVDGTVVMVQLSESMDINRAEDVTREVLVFDTDPDGRITRIEIFIQRAAAPTDR
jgi:ketosteroid isomerase-like protein